jgi:hypothetical protein
MQFLSARADCESWLLRSTGSNSLRHRICKRLRRANGAVEPRIGDRFVDRGLGNRGPIYRFGDSVRPFLPEALRRLRNGGSQFVRVEHVHVNEGGQAVIGNVSSSGKLS